MWSYKMRITCQQLMVYSVAHPIIFIAHLWETDGCVFNVAAGSIWEERLRLTVG
jgi:hypothetical protein